MGVDPWLSNIEVEMFLPTAWPSKSWLFLSVNPYILASILNTAADTLIDYTRTDYTNWLHTNRLHINRPRINQVNTKRLLTNRIRTKQMHINRLRNLLHTKLFPFCFILHFVSFSFHFTVLFINVLFHFLSFSSIFRFCFISLFFFKITFIFKSLSFPFSFCELAPADWQLTIDTRRQSSTIDNWHPTIDNWQATILRRECWLGNWRRRSDRCMWRRAVVRYDEQLFVVFERHHDYE